MSVLVGAELIFSSTRAGKQNKLCLHFFSSLLPGSTWSHGDGRTTRTARIQREFLRLLPLHLQLSFLPTADHCNNQTPAYTEGQSLGKLAEAEENQILLWDQRQVSATHTIFKGLQAAFTGQDLSMNRNCRTGAAMFVFVCEGTHTHSRLPQVTGWFLTRGQRLGEPLHTDSVFA